MTVNHIQINVSDLEESKKFYSEMFNLLGWRKFIDEEGVISWTDGTSSIFLNQTQKEFLKNKFHRKNIGLNHLAFKVNSRKDVDNFFNKFLNKRKERVLYGGPKGYPEYAKGYYAVYFEDPDRIKLEVMFL